jgi:hypothetical protein
MTAFLRLGSELRNVVSAEAERNGAGASAPKSWDEVGRLVEGDSGQDLFELTERLLDAQKPKPELGGRSRIETALAGLQDKSLGTADPLLARGWWKLHHTSPERLRGMAEEARDRGVAPEEVVGFLERLADEKELETSDFAPTVEELAAHWRSIWLTDQQLCEHCRPRAQEARQELEYELRAWVIQKAEQRRNKAQAEVEAAHERWQRSISREPTERPAA